MTTNTAAWLEREKAHPFTVKEAPYPNPTPEEVVVKSFAAAVNQIDWKLQRYAYFPLKYPTIIGVDVAGEVVEVGSAVTNLKKGDRVAAHAHNLIYGGDAEHGGYQAYTRHSHRVVSPIPDSMSFERAAVLPLAISTAASGLYEDDGLKMQRPSLNPKPVGESVLIWGASSSIGSLTLQLAKASGYEVVTTASPKHFDYAKSLGADHVLDYHSKTVVDELVDLFKGKIVVGAFDAIGEEDTTRACAAVLSRSKGGKHVSDVLHPPKDLPPGITAHFMFAGKIVSTDVSKSVCTLTVHVRMDYVPEALKVGKLQAQPDPEIVGKGLEDVQKAVDRQAEGVSAKKIVCMIA
ncbi:MAG: hypothetical protein Q9159_006937 [Coniocarpon cinnabarinum]